MTLYALPPRNPAAQHVGEGMNSPSPSTALAGSGQAAVEPVSADATQATTTAVKTLEAKTVVSVIQQTVTTTPVASRTDLLAQPAEWTWQEFRDYVVAQIEQTSGLFPRDSKKEYGIFNRFLKTYGQDGIRVAKYAFEVCGGWWNGAPISITRFAKGSDPYFVQPILDRLRDSA